MALLWGFPLGVGAALFAPALVPRLLGESWTFAVPLLQIFAITAALNQIGFNWTAFAQARGETRVLALGALSAMIGTIAVGVPLLLSHGISGFGVGILVGTLAAMVVRLVYLVRLFPARKIAIHVARSFVPTLPAAAVILAGRAIFELPDTLTRLLVEGAVFVTLVAATTWLMEGRLLREAIGYLRQRTRRSEAQAEPATRLA
jgi:O-antigen/teichoic acid export membrane protein